MLPLTRAALRLSVRTARLVLVHFTAFHHEHRVADIRDVLQRIAIGGNKVSLHSGRDAADLATESERFSGPRCRTDDGLHGWLTRIAHAVDEFFAIKSVAARHRIG